MSKIDHLINIPWKKHGRDVSGVDCWGLVRLAYMDLFGIRLPIYDVSPDDVCLVAETVEVGLSAWREVDSALFGDLLLFFVEIPKWPTHCAMAIDNAHMLHIRKDQSSGTEVYDDSYRGQIWKYRLTGIYRHAERVI